MQIKMILKSPVITGSLRSEVQMDGEREAVPFCRWKRKLEPLCKSTWEVPQQARERLSTWPGNIPPKGLCLDHTTEKPGHPCSLLLHSHKGSEPRCPLMAVAHTYRVVLFSYLKMHEVHTYTDEAGGKKPEWGRQTLRGKCFTFPPIVMPALNL